MMGSLVLLLFLLPTAIGGPVSWQTDDFQNDPIISTSDCSASCTGSNKFNYEVGSTYIYDYEATTATNMQGASESVARLDVKAKATIQVLSKCELVLMLSDVTVMRSDPDSPRMIQAEDETFKLALERNMLRFSFQDGRIDSLCPSDGDETTSLNFKRGVLSIFQNSMTQLQNGENMQEIDVTGECPTSYTVTQKGWKSTEIIRTKDLLGCSDRHSFRTALKSTPIHVPDTIKSLPLLKGNYKCTQMVTNEGRLSTATCTESLVFRPFSKKESGARTETVQKLTFVSRLSNINTRKDLVTSRTDLLFDHEESSEKSDKTLWTARELLTSLCRITVQDLPVEVPDLFTSLVYAMRELKSTQLTDLYQQINRGSICQDNKDKLKKFFLDALPMVETSSSMDVMVQMLLGGDVSGTQVDYWLNSLHFVHKPTSEMIMHLLGLVKSETYQLKSLLPVSSLIKTYCQTNSDCLTSSEVSDVISILENVLDNKCLGADEKLVLMTLRAAGNLGYSDKLADKLKDCIRSKNTAMNARVFAAQAYLGISCSADRQVLMKTFQDVNEDSELRIAAYLGVMHCWSEDILKQVKLVLETETSNQVSSFVWTHLTNLMETSSPYKQALKDIVNDEVLKKKAGISGSKHSGNYEVSFFSEKFGVGATAESNLVWSSKSFLPRSAMVNLTVDIFGQSVQLLELGGRVQGIESVIQRFIGSKLFKGGEAVTSTGTSRCSKQEKMDDMKNEYATDLDKLTASVYLRTFGHELDFRHYGEKELLALREKAPGKDGAKDSNNEISFSQSIMFMESQMTVPTVAGIPLKLSINGTASLDLQVQMQVDMKKLKMKSTFDFRPSGAVLISGLMSINAGPTSAGLKMSSTLHTSTSLKGHVEVMDNQVVNVFFDTPEKVMDILEIKTDFFIVHNKIEKKQQMLPDKKMKLTSCTPDSVYQITGFELCTSVSYVDAPAISSAPYMPFNGPLLLSLTLEKKDAPSGYKLFMQYIQNEATSTANINLETPGSKVDRKISVGYYLDSKDRKLDGQFVSPWKKILFKGTYPKARSNSHLFSASATVDGEEYKIMTQADKKTSKGKQIWLPTLEITRPKNSKLLSYSPESLSASGSVEIHDDLQEISAELTANVISNDQTAVGRTLKRLLKDGYIGVKAKYINREKQKTLYGSLGLNKKDSYSATFQVQQGDKKSGSLNYEPTVVISTPENQKLFLLSGKIDYKAEKSMKSDVQIIMDQTMKEPIYLNVTFNKSGKSKYAGKGNLTSGFIVMNVVGSIDLPLPFRGKKSGIVNKWTVDYYLPTVKDKELRKNKLFINSKIHDESAKSVTKYKATLNVDSKNYPAASFDANLQLGFQNASTNFKLLVKPGADLKKVKGKDNSQITVVVDLGHQVSDSSANITYDLQLLYPVKEMEYQLKGKHEHQMKQKFKLETYAAIVYQKGKTVEVRLMGNDNGKKNAMDLSGSLEVNYPSIVIDNKVTEGGKYKVVTTVSQNAEKEYTHTVSLQLNELKHSMLNKFKKNRDDFFFMSQLEVHGDQRKKLTIKAIKNAEQSEAGFVLLLGNGVRNDVYSVTVDMTSPKDKQSQTYFGQVTVLERRVEGTIEIGNKRSSNELKFNAEVLWDALYDKKQRLSIDFNYIIDKENGRYDLSLVVTSPFVNHTNYVFRKLSVHNSKEMRQELRFVFGRPVDELSYSVSARLPLSLERFEIKGDLVTPLKHLHKLGVGIAHKFDGSRYLSSSLNGTYNNDYLVVAMQAKNSGDKARKDLLLSTSLNSSIPIMQNIVISLTHKMDDKLYETEALYQRNSVKYSANMTTKFSKANNNYDLDSTLSISIPEDKSLLVQVVYNQDQTLAKFDSMAKVSQKSVGNTQVNVAAKFDKQAQEYGVDVKIAGKWPAFSGMELDFKHSMLNGISGVGNLLVRTNPNVRSTLTYSGTNLKLKSNYNPYVTEMNILYEKYPFTLLLEHKNPQAEDKKISLEASVNVNDQKEALLEVNLITPYEHFRNLDLKSKVMNNYKDLWRLESLLSLDTRRKIQIEGEVDPNHFNAKMITPFKELSKVDFGKSYNLVNQNWLSTEAFLEVQPYFNKVKLEKNVTLQAPYSARLDLDLPDLPIKYLKLNMTGHRVRSGYSYDVVARYHPNKEVNLKMKTKMNMNKFPQDTSVSLIAVTPFEVLPRLDTSLNIDLEQGKWVGVLDLSSGYMNMRLKETFAQTLSYTDLEITSPEFEAVMAGLHLDFGDAKGVNVTLSAPSVGRTVMGFKKKLSSWADVQGRVFGEYNGKELDMDLGWTHNELQTKSWLTYIYPGSDYSYLKTSVHKFSTSAQDFDIGGFLQLGKTSKPFNISTQYAFVDKKVALGMTLETPYTDAMSYYVQRETPSKGENNIVVYGKYSNNFLIDFLVSSKLTGNSFNYVARNEYTMSGKNNKFGTSMNVKWSEDVPRIEAKLDGYLDKKSATITVLSVGNKMKKLTVENLDVTFKSNIPKFQDVGLSADIDKDTDKYSGTLNLEYMDGNEAQLTFDMTKPSMDTVQLNAVLGLPQVEGYQRNTLSYKQVALSKGQIESDVKVVTGSGDTMNGKLDYSNNEVTVTLTGPVQEFESLRFTGQFDERKQQILGSANLKLTQDARPAELNYNITLNEFKPLIMTYKVKTPYKNFRTTSLTIQHEFQSCYQTMTTSKLQLDSLGDVISQISYKIDSPLNVEFKASLTSGIKDLENLKLVIKSEDKERSHTSQFQLGWQPDKEIKLENKWRLVGSDQNVKLTSSFDLASPFDVKQLASIRLEHSYGPNMVLESIKVLHNDKSYFDADLFYQKTQYHNATVVINSPRPMVLALKGSMDSGKFDGNLKLNWDKTSPDSHIEVASNYNDQSDAQNTDMTLKLKVIHPVRIMGVESTYRRSDKEVYSASHITWDEENGNVIGYDVNWTNTSTRYSQKYEGYTKVALPQRSVKLQGTFSDTGSILTTNSAFLWDADKDDKKRLTVLTEVENKDNFKRVNLNINLPNINKQLILNGITKGRYGTTLIDSKAEISYSSDPQKMIVIRSLLSNFEVESKDNYNYTAQFEFRHPKTNSDVKLISHVAHVGKVCSAGGQLSFLSASREQKFVEMWSILDAAKQTLNLRVASPLKTISMLGQVVDFASHKDFTLTTFENDKETTALDVKLDEKRKEIVAEFNYDRDDPTKILKLTSRYVNNSAVQVSIVSQNGVQTSEGIIAVRLNTSEILHTRVTWRPMLFNDMKMFISSKITAFSYTANEVFNASVTHIGTDLKSRYLLISQELMTEMDQVFRLINDELNNFNMQLNTYSTEFRRFTQRNDLNIRDLGNNARAAFYAVTKGLQDLARRYSVYFNSVTAATNELMNQLKMYPVAERYASSVRELVNGLMTARQVLEKALNDATEDLDKLSHLTYKAYLDVSRSLDQKLQSYSRSVFELPMYQKMMKQMERLGQQGSQMFPEFAAYYNAFYLKLHQILQDQFHDVMTREEFQHTYASLNEIHQQIMYWNKEQKMDLVAQRLVEMSKNLLLLELTKIRSSLMNSRVIAYDPEKGELQFELHLPFTLESLKEKPKLSANSILNTVQKMADVKVPENLPVVLNNYYNSLNSLTPASWVPSFKASAYLIGGQHIFTFDEATYDFSSPCSYVLARDMLHDNFSVVYNYEKRGRRPPVKSICFTIENSLNFDITDDFKLHVQGRDTEMPYYTDKVMISRDMDSIHVHYVGGLDVVVIPRLDMYRVTVENWYHGRVKGMLGQYDNEAANDVVLEKDYGDFEVDRRACTVKNIAATTSLKKDDKCYELFYSMLSQFPYCHDKVDPAPFVKMCQAYKQTKSEEDAIHLATEQYRYMCADKDVYIEPLEEYVPCNSEKPFVVDGTDPLYQSADVVFVVEDSPCNQWATTSLASIVTELNKVLPLAGKTKNNFGLVSYGGLLNKRMARTINGQHFGEAPNFLKALETMKFTASETEGDLFSAMTLAMSYPYRPGVAKIIVTVPCSECEFSFTQNHWLSSELTAMGFTVHVLRKQSLVPGEARLNANQRLIKHDVDSSHLSIISGEESDMKYSDSLSSCDIIAAHTSGAVFDSSFLGEKTKAQQEFIKILTRRIGHNVKLPTCQKCECNNMLGRIECEVCRSNSVLSF